MTTVGRFTGFSFINKYKIVCTATAGMFAFVCQHSFAQEVTGDVSKTPGVTESNTSSKSTKSADLQEVIVTGSLIPQQRAETSTPVSVITLDDMQTKGFASVADALQRSSFATGSVQGAQYVGGFTQGAQTLSMFGLTPSYTKYLIDGRPLADYPALYNGTDIFASISGIPTLLIDHIDILPGGQSSIYGSDAIAGVVNIVLKKKSDGAAIDARAGWTDDGGGTQYRIGVVDGFNPGNWNIVVGAQYEKKNPIWGYQRDLTKQFFTGGTSPQTGERDYLIFGLDGTYYFQDPSNCANVAGQFGNSVAKLTRPGYGDYCGTYKSGYYTIDNGLESTQGYLHADTDLNDHVQLFTDVLWNHDVTRFSSGTAYFGTAGDPTSPYYYFEDPNIPDLLNVQHVFSPEEAGNLASQMDKDTNNSIRGTLGVKGSLGSSDWTYTVDMTYTENKLTEKTYLAFTSAINNFFAPIFGDPIGYDSANQVNIFAPNYAAFYQPITPDQYASFTGYATSYSRTEDSLARAQLTNSSLFSLPGGEAGFAAVIEGGAQGWDYAPDPRYLDGETYLYTAVAGSGHRSRYAATSELRLPLLKSLTVDVSGRYDDYKISGSNVDKATYNIGVEYRPVKTLLLRGRYGTAFKAPTLSDEFQGQSGFYQQLNDYYLCAQNGYTGTNLGNCPYAQEYVFGTTEGNTRLRPINAKVADLGIVWAPTSAISVAADYMLWNIHDEVVQQDSDKLLSIESQCRLGDLDISSPTCVAALAQVTRDNSGNLVSVDTPKINAAQETLHAIRVELNYTLTTDRVGSFKFSGSYSNILKHTFVPNVGDPTIDLLADPTWSEEFKTKGDFSVTWDIGKLGTTLYVERYGRTPNYLASIYGYDTAGAGTLGAWTLANLSAQYEVIPGLELSANIENLFNRMPPVDNSYPGTERQPYNEFNYDIYGRRFFVGASYKFGR
ncbi:MAG: TonB-dependent receptor [Steroidobacter sp.]